MIPDVFLFRFAANVTAKNYSFPVGSGRANGAPADGVSTAQRSAKQQNHNHNEQHEAERASANPDGTTEYGCE